jgi:uncharacterized protein involved in exopolysaccharide biosynthesis
VTIDQLRKKNAELEQKLKEIREDLTKKLDDQLKINAKLNIDHTSIETETRKHTQGKQALERRLETQSTALKEMREEMRDMRKEKTDQTQRIL